MRVMLDTNICIYLIKKRPRQVLEQFNAYSVGEIGISSITAAELRYGAEKSQYPTKNQQALMQFLLPLTVSDFDEQASVAYGEITAALEARGVPIGPLDTPIADQGVSLEIALVTSHVREFSTVPDLRIENWASHSVCSEGVR